MTSCCDSFSISRARSGSTSPSLVPDALEVGPRHDAGLGHASSASSSIRSHSSSLCRSPKISRSSGSAYRSIMPEDRLGARPARPARRGMPYLLRDGVVGQRQDPRGEVRAFLAPALPMATVATGTPGGIWTTA